MRPAGEWEATCRIQGSQRFPAAGWQQVLPVAPDSPRLLGHMLALLQVTRVPGGEETEDAWWARSRMVPGAGQQESVLQAVAALPGRRLAAGTDSGAVQLHTVVGDHVELNSVLLACL